MSLCPSSPLRNEGFTAVAELAGSRLVDNGRPTNVNPQATRPSGSSKLLTKIWRDVLPVATIMRCSYLIIMICTSIFGFQKDQTLLAVTDLALNAALVACLEGVAALFLGLLYKIRLLYWVARVAHDTVERRDKISDTLHLATLACFSVACASLIAFLFQTMWHTRPHISFGVLSSVVLTGALVSMICYRFM
ncbi:hypothetical protein BOTBODRAFT_175765 [Botryobasidium botryosum FD-172 SS1]|uniref:Uncharacterized protein n=1 Tax=Botryobasidium botryosum (strain FD-172 SS1) TaxID=930990 RepID=A0A067MEL9_BOTB1|nr:hypothetical protein BOTBODRAFT_175765 [Botryobasidium botryosum FD-172 SS1]